MSLFSAESFCIVFFCIKTTILEFKRPRPRKVEKKNIVRIGHQQFLLSATMMLPLFKSTLIPFPNDKCLYRSKFKVFADSKINVTSKQFF